MMDQFYPSANEKGGESFFFSAHALVTLTASTTKMVKTLIKGSLNAHLDSGRGCTILMPDLPHTKCPGISVLAHVGGAHKQTFAVSAMKTGVARVQLEKWASTWFISERSC